MAARCLPGGGGAGSLRALMRNLLRRHSGLLILGAISLVSGAAVHVLRGEAAFRHALGVALGIAGVIAVALLVAVLLRGLS